MGDAFLGSFFATERDESLAFQIENVLLAHQLWTSYRPAGQNAGELSCDVRVVLRGISATHEKMDGQFGRRKKLLPEHFDLSSLRAFLPACRWRLVTTAGESQGSFLGIGDETLAIHSDAVFAPEKSQFAALFCAGADFGHGNGLKNGSHGVE